MTDLKLVEETVRDSRIKQLEQHLMNLPRMLDPEGNPVPKPDSIEELFWMMEKACFWLCEELDRLEDVIEGVDKNLEESKGIL